MKKYNRKVVFLLSDIHSGYQFGLCNPETELPDGMSDAPVFPKLGSTQMFLWSLYERSIQELIHFAGSDEVILLFVGDLTHGNKHTGETMTSRVADQQIIAYYNFLPILDKVKQLKSVRFLIGTAAHNFGEGSSDYLVSLMLKERYPKKDISALYHGRFNVQGAVFDVAHHGPGPGRYVANKGNAVRGYLRDRMYRDLFDNIEPAQVYVRGHYHEYVKEFLLIEHNRKLWESFLYVCPPMCMPGDWTRQAISSPPNVTVGSLALEVINDGQIGKTKVITESFDLRSFEAL